MQANPTPQNQPLEFTIDDTVLGSGAFSEVRLAQNIHTNELVAAKITDLTKYRRYYNKEVKALTSIPIHPNIVSLVQYGEDGGTGYIFTEYVEGKTLLDYVEETGKGKGLSEEEALQILLQLIQGIEIVHRSNFSHNDLKPDNIFFNPMTKTARIFDFGLSTEVGSDGTVTECCGSPLYMAPEVLTQTSEHNAFLSDIWSLGLIFYFMLVGDLPWSKVDSLPHLVDFIHMGKLPIPVSVSKATRELLAGMLQLTPRARWSTERIKRHIQLALKPLDQAKRLRIVTLYATGCKF
jgi:serine/threonine protein kinase